MSKVLEATCLAGVVKVGALPVPSATILSEGVGASEGVLLMQDDEQFYVPDTTPDLKTTLDKLTDSLTQINTSLTQAVTALTQSVLALTLLDAKPLGTLPPVPAVAGNTAAITAAAAAITAAQVQLVADTTALTVLKGMLK